MNHTTNVPAMAGTTSSNGQLKLASKTVRRARTRNPYVISNIGDRIWHPGIQDHVEYQEFYRLAREDNLDLSTLKINKIVDCGTSNGEYKFDGTLSETEWLEQNGLNSNDKIIVASPTNTDRSLVGLLGQAIGREGKIETYVEVCVSQAVQLKEKDTEIERLQNALSGINERLGRIRSAQLHSNREGSKALSMLEEELGIDVPF